MRRWTVLLVVLSLACACQSEATLEDLELSQDESDLAGQFADQRLRAMTRNLYVGTDVAEVIAAPPPEVPFEVAEGFQTIIDSDVPGRMGRIADEIWLTQPHLVGLQEVSLVRIQSPGDFVLGGTTPAEDVVFDFLAILQASLDERGLDYRVAATVENTDIELPMIKPDGTFDDVRLTDFDVILVRDDVATANPVGENFAASFTVSGITVLRGFTAVDADVKGVTHRFVNTHLEPAVPEVRQAQALELVQTLAQETRPIVVAGDLNAPAPDGDAYQLMLGAGYSDLWNQRIGRPRPGFTCCQAEDLRNPASQLTERIDFIFARNFDPELTVAFTVGDRVFGKTDSGLWPSDHAGVVGITF